MRVGNIASIYEYKMSEPVWKYKIQPTFKINKNQGIYLPPYESKM